MHLLLTAKKYSSHHLINYWCKYITGSPMDTFDCSLTLISLNTSKLVCVPFFNHYHTLSDRDQWKPWYWKESVQFGIVNLCANYSTDLVSACVCHDLFSCVSNPPMTFIWLLTMTFLTFISFSPIIPVIFTCFILSHALKRKILLGLVLDYRLKTDILDK